MKVFLKRSIIMFVSAVVILTAFPSVPNQLDLTASAATNTTTADKDVNFAPTDRSSYNAELSTSNYLPIDKLRPKNIYNLELNYSLDSSVKENEDFFYALKNDPNYKITSHSVSSSSNWGTENFSEITLELLAQSNESIEKKSPVHIVNVNVTGIKCLNISRKMSLTIKYEYKDVNGAPQNKEYTFKNITFPESYFSNKSSTSTTETDPAVKPESNTILENYNVTDKSGQKIEKIDKDTAPFNLTVVYLEYGLEGVDIDEMSSGDFSVFFKTMGGFSSATGTRGKLERITSSANGIPRFRATFSGLTYNEDDGNNTTELEMIYDIEDHYTKGNLGLIIKQAKTKKEGEENELSPLKPYIIIDQFSYGDKEIVAGSEFTLNISFTNTSSSIPLENIVMKVTPPEDSITIASSSNTKYIANLPEKGSVSHGIELRAMPTAKVGSAEVTITFTYQYTDLENKKREEVVDLTQKIGIPITQIDRFELDPITEAPPSAVVGEIFYVPVSFINRGKATTFNISATATSKKEIEVHGEHGNNLEAGKTDSLEVGIICNEVGELVGKIEVQYEDEMGNQKVLSEPFKVFVEEPYVPDINDMNNQEEAPPPQAGKLTFVLIILGCFFVMLPLVYYIIKRISRKESEGSDEDF